MALVPFSNRQKRTIFCYLKTVRLFYLRPRIERIVFRQQIQAILIHTDPFGFGMFSQSFVQTFRNPQFELTRISVCAFGFGDFQAFLDSRLEPCSFGIFKICYSGFHRLSASYTSDKFGIGCNVSAFVKISYYFCLVWQSHIFIYCSHLR